jgi:hypothetical protein
MVYYHSCHLRFDRALSIVSLCVVGNRGYAVMHGDRSKSGKIVAPTASVVAPLPMNTPLRKESRIVPNASGSASQPWGYGQSSTETATQKPADDTTTSSASIPSINKAAPWSKAGETTASQSKSQEASAISAPASRGLASTRNWADMDSDDEDDTSYRDQGVSEGITITRDEVVDSGYGNSYSHSNASSQHRESNQATNSWRSNHYSEGPAYGRASDGDYGSVSSNSRFSYGLKANEIDLTLCCMLVFSSMTACSDDLLAIVILDVILT